MTCIHCGREIFRHYFEGKFNYSVKDGEGHHNWWDCVIDPATGKRFDHEPEPEDAQ